MRLQLEFGIEYPIRYTRAQTHIVYVRYRNRRTSFTVVCISARVFRGIRPVAYSDRS